MEVYSFFGFGLGGVEGRRLMSLSCLCGWNFKLMSRCVTPWIFFYFIRWLRKWGRCSAQVGDSFVVLSCGFDKYVRTSGMIYKKLLECGWAYRAK